MNVDGTGRTRAHPHRFEDSYPVWSPDGKQLAFQSQPGRQLRDLHDEHRRHGPDAADEDADGRDWSKLAVEPRPARQLNAASASLPATSTVRSVSPPFARFIVVAP